MHSGAQSSFDSSKETNVVSGGTMVYLASLAPVLAKSSELQMNTCSMF